MKVRKTIVVDAKMLRGMVGAPPNAFVTVNEECPLDIEITWVTDEPEPLRGPVAPKVEPEP